MFAVGAFAAFIGLLVLLAGIWAALSNERIVCNIALKTYVRMEGQGLRKRLIQGSFAELDAIVLLTEEIPVPMVGGRTVIYRLVLHWKGAIQPLLVVERESHTVAPNEPLNAAATGISTRGQKYARVLGVTFYDNSYFLSPSPLPFA